MTFQRCTTDPRLRRQASSLGDKVCCRDPNKIDKDYADNGDDYSDYNEFVSDYEDMDGITMYNMKTPYDDDNYDTDDDMNDSVDVVDLAGLGRTSDSLRAQTSDKLRRRKKKKRPQPLTRLEAPGQNRAKRKKNRSSLDFFRNGK